MDLNEIFTIEFLNEAFEYRDGSLYWKERPDHHFCTTTQKIAVNKRFSGKLAGTLCHGYFRIKIYQHRVRAHHIVYMMHHGYIPELIDHINGDRKDNRIENLRPATYEQNARNRKTNTNNTSGVKGVHRSKKTGKWLAYIKELGRKVHLGSFDTLEDASIARKEAQCRAYGEFANDR